MSDQEGLIKSYLYVGLTEADAMYTAPIEFMGVTCVIFVDPDTGSTGMFRLLKDGSLGQPLAFGQVARNERADGTTPNVRGALITRKQTVFDFAGWDHTDEATGEEYITLRIRPKEVRKGRSI